MDFLKRKKAGTGGLLFIFTTMALAFLMVFTVTYIRVTTARSVAESVEHTIALQCLASAYTHPDKYGETNYWTSNKIFDPITSTSKEINPLEEFNRIMTSYNLMGKQATKIAMAYNKTDNMNGGVPHSTFEIQVSGWTSKNYFWSNVIPIVPNPVKVVIEDDYESKL